MSTILGLVRRAGLAAALAMACAPVSRAASPVETPPHLAIGMTSAAMIAGCIDAAATTYRVPPAVLVILLRIEGGTPGHVSQNTNQTVDIGPMQVNQIWLPEIARHWHATIAESYEALRDNFCANVEGGSWILRQAIDEAHGDLWTGVAIYHSHAPAYQAAYLHHVLDQVAALERLADPRHRPARAQE